MAIWYWRHLGTLKLAARREICFTVGAVLKQTNGYFDSAKQFPAFPEFSPAFTVAIPIGGGPKHFFNQSKYPLVCIKTSRSDTKDTIKKHETTQVYRVELNIWLIS